MTPTSPNPQLQLPPAGTVLGARYRLERRLGQGGMGAVFAATDLAAGRPVAVKLPLGQLSPNRLARFQREGQAAAALRHPGILTVHHAGEDQGRPFLVYELVPGCRDLSEVGSDLPRGRRVELVRDAARALGHAHAQGVVHRDVKPENLLVSNDGRLLVADFGLATTLDAERLTQTGALLGTPNYLAPETFSGVWGPAADVWALGVVLYELLTGALPFEGRTLTELSARICSGRVRAPREQDREIPAELEAVCLHALHPDPQRRYPHGDAFAADLEAVLAGSAPSAPGLPRVSAATRRRLLLAAPALLAVTGVLWILLRGGQPGPGSRSPSPSPSAVASSPAQPAPEDAENARRALRKLASAERYWAALAWLRRFPAATGRDDVRRDVAELAAAGPRVRITHAAGTTSAQVLPGGRVLVQVALPKESPGGELTLWSVAGASAERVAQRRFPAAALVLPWPGRREVLLYTQQEFAWLDLEQGSQETIRRWRPAVGPGTGLVVKELFSLGPPSAPRCAIIALGQVYLWSTDPEAEPRLLGQAATLTGRGAARPGGAWVYRGVGPAGGEGYRLLAWNLTGETLPVLGLHEVAHRLALSPDGSTLAVGSSGLWLVPRVEGGYGAPRRLSDPEEPMHVSQRGLIAALVFTRDGRHLIALSHADGRGLQLKVWDTRSGAVVGRRLFRGADRASSATLAEQPGHVWVSLETGQTWLLALPGPLSPLAEDH